MASGADWLFIPEAPPEDGWENFMCERLGEVSGYQGFQPLENLRGRYPWDLFFPYWFAASIHSLWGTRMVTVLALGCSCLCEGHGADCCMP